MAAAPPAAASIGASVAAALPRAPGWHVAMDGRRLRQCGRPEGCRRAGCPPTRHLPVLCYRPPLGIFQLGFSSSRGLLIRKHFSRPAKHTLAGPHCENFLSAMRRQNRHGRQPAQFVVNEKGRRQSQQFTPAARMPGRCRTAAAAAKSQPDRPPLRAQRYHHSCQSSIAGCDRLRCTDRSERVRVALSKQAAWPAAGAEAGAGVESAIGAHRVPRRPALTHHRRRRRRRSPLPLDPAAAALPCRRRRSYSRSRSRDRDYEEPISPRAAKKKQR